MLSKVTTLKLLNSSHHSCTEYGVPAIHSSPNKATKQPSAALIYNKRVSLRSLIDFNLGRECGAITPLARILSPRGYPQKHIFPQRWVKIATCRIEKSEGSERLLRSHRFRQFITPLFYAFSILCGFLYHSTDYDRCQTSLLKIASKHHIGREGFTENAPFTDLSAPAEGSSAITDHSLLWLVWFWCASACGKK